MLETSRDFVRNAPVTTLTTAESLVGAVLTFLATHGVLGNIDVSATTQTVAPFVALALPAVFGALKWRLVTPWAKVQDVAERAGLASDADFARFDAMLDDKFRALGLVVDDTDTDTSAETVGETVPEHVAEHEAVETADTTDAADPAADIATATATATDTDEDDAGQEAYVSAPVETASAGAP